MEYRRFIDRRVFVGRWSLDLFVICAASSCLCAAAAAQFVCPFPLDALTAEKDEEEELRPPLPTNSRPLISREHLKKRRCLFTAN